MNHLGYKNICVCWVAFLAAGSPCLAAVERTPFKQKYPEAAGVASLVGEAGGRFRTGFPVLRNFLELSDPWKLDVGELKEAVFPQYFDPGHSFPFGDKLPTKSMELIFGTPQNPALFVDRRYSYDWRYISEEEWKKKKWVDWPGLKVWDHWAYVTDFWVNNPARPLIRIHLGVPPVGWTHMMNTVTCPPLPESLRKEVPEKLDKIVEALRPYGAKKLDLTHPRIRRYLLPGGTLMTFHDRSLDFADRPVMLKIDFQPAESKKRTALPAFPGAEGYGAFTPGGRGGKVYIVTTLEDYLPEERPGRAKGVLNSPGYPPVPKEDPIPGSLREAVEAEGPRIVMFGVTGTIELKAPLTLKNPYLTLVGHTAPGHGVQIRNWWIKDHLRFSHDVVLRYLRVRVGEIKGPGKLRRVRGDESQALAFTGVNIIVDHCEFAYGNDQIVNIRAHAPVKHYPFGVVRALSSFQWNYVYGSPTASTHSKGSHPMGYILNGEGFLSFHHNLTAHVDRRNPRGGGLDFDWRNNILYHYRNSGTGGKNINYVGNTIKRGGQNFHWTKGEYGYVYAHDNQGGGGQVVKAPAAVIHDKPWNHEPVKTDPAAVGYEKVLKHGGADLPVRDVITRFVSDSVRNNTGNYPGTPADWPHGGYATYPPAELKPDADKDGMPDWWEEKYGLDPNRADDNAGDKDKDGYTNIEEFINDTDPTEYIDYHDPANNVHSLHRADTIHAAKE